MDYGIEQSKILKPKIIIPFGSNLFHSDNPNSLMNKAVATPIDFVNYAKKKDKVMSKNYKTFLSDSYCIKKNGKIFSHYENISVNKFNTALKMFINKNIKAKKSKKKLLPIAIKNKHLL